MRLARVDGLTWVAPVLPGHDIEDQTGVATNEDRERYRKIAQEHLGAERGLIVE